MTTSIQSLDAAPAFRFPVSDRFPGAVKNSADPTTVLVVVPGLIETALDSAVLVAAMGTDNHNDESAPRGTMTALAVSTRVRE